jgi:hypothetical protein
MRTERAGDEGVDFSALRLQVLRHKRMDEHQQQSAGGKESIAPGKNHCAIITDLFERLVQ